MNRRKRYPVVIPLTPEIKAMKDHIVMVIWLAENQSIGIRFTSPEHFLEFTALMLEKAAEVWPDNPYIREYLED